MARQWCGRLGKKDNCQIGVFLAYVSAQGHAPLDRPALLAQGLGRRSRNDARPPMSPRR